MERLIKLLALSGGDQELGVFGRKVSSGRLCCYELYLSSMKTLPRAAGVVAQGVVWAKWIV